MCKFEQMFSFCDIFVVTSDNWVYDAVDWANFKIEKQSQNLALLILPPRPGPPALNETCM